MTAQELEEHAQRMQEFKGSTTPATLGTLAAAADAFTKALGQKLRQRDARIAALEARIAALEAQLTSTTGE